MEDIKIYHSLRKNIPTTLLWAFFTAVGFHMLIVGNKGYKAWFCIAVFGTFFLFMLFTLLKERIRHAPYLVITDKSVRWQTGKGYEIQFADVKEFRIVEPHAKRGILKRSGIFYIGVCYKDKKEQETMTDAGSIERGTWSFIGNNTKWEEVVLLPVEDLTVRPAEICELLNERLSVFNLNKDDNDRERGQADHQSLE